MSENPVHAFASSKTMLALVHGIETADADAVLIIRGRHHGAAVQVMGLTVRDEAAIVVLLRDALDATGDDDVQRSVYDPSASPG